MLTGLLKQIAARQEAVLSASSNPYKIRPNVDEQDLVKLKCPFHEVKEIISLPRFDAGAVRKQRSPDEIELDPKITSQLRLFVSSIAKMYKANPFHSFEHCSHVVMAVIKLMGRIVAPEHNESLIPEGVKNVDDLEHNIAASLHDHTYGITSDPLTQFACAFSALIHGTYNMTSTVSSEVTV